MEILGTSLLKLSKPVNEIPPAKVVMFGFVFRIICLLNSSNCWNQIDIRFDNNS